jgi:hypothetical protein
MLVDEPKPFSEWIVVSSAGVSLPPDAPEAASAGTALAAEPAARPEPEAADDEPLELEPRLPPLDDEPLLSCGAASARPLWSGIA